MQRCECLCGEVYSRETTVPSLMPLCPNLALPRRSDVILHLCVCACICGIFSLTKGSHSHPLALPHPEVLRGLQPRGVGAGLGHFSYVSLDWMVAFRRQIQCV